MPTRSENQIDGKLRAAMRYILSESSLDLRKHRNYRWGRFRRWSRELPDSCNTRADASPDRLHQRVKGSTDLTPVLQPFTRHAGDVLELIPRSPKAVFLQAGLRQRIRNCFLTETRFEAESDRYWLTELPPRISL